MTSTTGGVPDLLRRFVPTPFSSTITVAGAEVTLRSNESFAGVNLRSIPSKDRRETIIATILRDSEASAQGSEIVLIKEEHLATVLVGEGTIFVVDCERNEILGFLAPSVSSAQFADELLPMLVDVYRDLKSQGHPSPNE